MAASIRKNVTFLVTSRYHCLHKEWLLKRVLSTLHEEKTGSIRESRTNWTLDTEITNRRRHAGVRQIKPVELPEVLASNIASVLEDLTVRNLIPEATKLCNYLNSRKRPVEEAELRVAAKHFSEEIGLEDVDADDVNSVSLPVESKKKMQHVMRKLKKNIYRWQSIEYNDVKSISYMISRMAPNYAVLLRVLNEIKQGDPEFQPASILDFGSGVGTTTWAAHSIWGEATKEHYMVEVSKAMHQLAERLLQVEPDKDELHIPNVYQRFFMPVSLRAKFSMTVSAYSLLELPSFQDRVNTVRSLWKLTDDYMVLIENGSYESYLALMEARDAVLMENRNQDESLMAEESEIQFPDRLQPQLDLQGSHVFAPCPHDLPCPRLLEESGIPCNFEQTYHPLVQYIGKRSSKVHTERFTYIILKKASRSCKQNWPRVVKPVLTRSRHVICRLCRTDGSLGEAVFTKAKHSKDLYGCARYTKWGDLLPATHGGINPTNGDS